VSAAAATAAAVAATKQLAHSERTALDEALLVGHSHLAALLRTRGVSDCG